MWLFCRGPKACDQISLADLKNRCSDHNHMDTKAILIDSLFKSFGDKAALEDFSLTISQGEVYGLLGPFGAGKSTLLHILLGFIHPSRGWIEIFGNPERTELRSRIGYMPERAQLHPRFRVREYLRFLGNFDDLGGIALEERIDLLLSRFGLQEQANIQISQLSRGAQQRLALAQALLNDPDLLILDEPFTGLDPAAQQDMLELLDNLRADQRTILLKRSATASELSSKVNCWPKPMPNRFANPPKICAFESIGSPMRSKANSRSLAPM
jgi:ABC-type multidrug transport system ATPase subunit